MATKIQFTDEQPKKSVKIRRIKFDVANKDYLFLFILVLLFFYFLLLLLFRTQNDFILGFSAGLIFHFLSKKDEMVSKEDPDKKNGSVKAINVPDSL